MLGGTRKMKKSVSAKPEFLRGLYTGLITAAAGPLLGLTVWIMGEAPALAQKMALITSTYAIIFGLAVGTAGALHTWLCGKFLAKKTK